ncbi:MAG: hypothetical protein D6812_13990, partial [Deltaproteobacteria bacterium]
LFQVAIAFHALVFYPVWPLYAQTEEEEEVNAVEQAKDFFCGYTEEEPDINELFLQLQAMAADEALPNIVLADAYKYQGCIMAQYGENEYQASLLFRKALRLNSRLGMCAQNPSLALFKKVIRETLDDTAPVIRHDPSTNRFADNRLTIGVEIAETGETAFSMPAEVLLFYRSPASPNPEGWATLQMFSDAPGNTAYSVVIPGTLLPKAEGESFDYYFQVTDELGNVGTTGSPEQPFSFVPLPETKTPPPAMAVTAPEATPPSIAEPEAPSIAERPETTPQVPPPSTASATSETVVEETAPPAFTTRTPPPATTGKPFWKSWPFWTVLGVVVVGSAVTTAAIASGGGSSSNPAENGTVPVTIVP